MTVEAANTGDAGSTAPSAGDFVGFVEATTATHVLGWAWAPRSPEQRLMVQALLDGKVVADTKANHERADLARNGIGDGRHAFELPLPEAVRARLADLRVVIRTEAGASVPLGAPFPADGTAERLDRLQKGIDALISSQRLLHRNLQAALVSSREQSKETETPERPQTNLVADTCGRLGEQLATLEVFAMRLDEQMAKAIEPSPHLHPHTAASRAAFAISALALAISVWGLWHALS